MLYSLDDVILIPAILSDINHRADCNIYNEFSKLPLFTAPMSCVIDMTNYNKFEEVGINTILPRSVFIDDRILNSKDRFVALSLEEFEDYFCDTKSTPLENKTYICVDIANGHMKKLYDLSKLAKELHGDNLVLMIGNIARPETYVEYAKIGVDYIRIGIGSGNVCTTSANTGIHYPMASLIDRCKTLKNSFNLTTKIVADGGFKNFDQINKALALGADYVMLGQILAKSEEACGEIRDRLGEYDFKDGDPSKIRWARYREYYGMSTKRAQKEFGKEGNTTAEGIVKEVKVEYTIAGWVDNFISYLRSAMSYTNSKTLEEFQGSKWEVITPTGRMSYYK